MYRPLLGSNFHAHGFLALPSEHPICYLALKLCILVRLIEILYFSLRICSPSETGKHSPSTKRIHEAFEEKQIPKPFHITPIKIRTLIDLSIWTAYQPLKFFLFATDFDQVSSTVGST